MEESIVEKRKKLEKELKISTYLLKENLSQSPIAGLFSKSPIQGNANRYNEQGIIPSISKLGIAPLLLILMPKKMKWLKVIMDLLK